MIQYHLHNIQTVVKLKRYNVQHPYFLQNKNKIDLTNNNVNFNHDWQLEPILSLKKFAISNEWHTANLISPNRDKLTLNTTIIYSAKSCINAFTVSEAKYTDHPVTRFGQAFVGSLLVQSSDWVGPPENSESQHNPRYSSP